MALSRNIDLRIIGAFPVPFKKTISGVRCCSLPATLTIPTTRLKMSFSEGVSRGSKKPKQKMAYSSPKREKEKKRKICLFENTILSKIVFAPFPLE